MNHDLDFNAEELNELRTLFFEQATEIIQSLNELIVRVESNPSDVDSLRAIRRAIHTLKGDSSAFGFSEITALAHHYEDALEGVRTGEKEASRALIDLLLAGADALAALVKHYGGDGSMPDTTVLIAGLAALGECERVTISNDCANPREPVISDKDQKIDVEADGIQQDAKAVARTEVVSSLELEETPEQTVERRHNPERRNVLERRQTQSLTIRVESERIDETMNLIGELIIQRSMISTLIAELEDQLGGSELLERLSETVHLSARTLSELQEGVMRLRLVAIDQVFRRFSRVVRDASVRLSKPVRLEVVGGQTEIDKSIVESISDPLLHLVRNACDHGIESPAVRRTNGKSEEGMITLRARRAGNRIVVEVEDDGAGINPDWIAAKALEKGLCSEQEVAQWTDEQKIGLIFLPGFSTAEQVSDMSGRGVGMDVVKTTIDSLGGTIAVSSWPGQGSRFVIKLPLMMAIVRAMLFKSAQRCFALPLESIKEITRLRPSEIKTINGGEAFVLRGEVLPLIRVDEALGLSDPQQKRLERLFAFVVDLGDGRQVGLGVEELSGEQELVLKTIDNALSQTTSVVVGASILGDGRVILILDANTLVEQASEGQREQLVLSGSEKELRSQPS